MKTLNSIGKQFAHELTVAAHHTAVRKEVYDKAEKLHVDGLGGVITSAYEHLRNASENAEESLLLQHAICRFYKRLLITPDRLANSGEELVAELTLAGYLANDSIPLKTVKQISEIASTYTAARKALSRSVNGDRLNSWTIDVLSVHVESLFNDHAPELALSNLAYNYFISVIDAEKLFGKKPVSYEASLLLSCQMTLLKYDNARLRYNLLARYQMKPENTLEYLDFNKNLDKIFEAKETDRLSHFVSRHGAQLRVLLSELDNTTLPAILEKPEVFAGNFGTAVRRNYSKIHADVNRGVWRSVIFLVITKFLIGLAIEVPYDLIVTGFIVWLPLVVNLFFPPIYMVVLRLTLIMPGPINSRALNEAMNKVIYADTLTPLYVSDKTASQHFGKAFSAVYILVILGVFGSVGYGLWCLGFGWPHLLVFYIFVSAASFLGFRLSRSIRDIEVIDGKQSFITMIRDFLYMPFVAIGRWINEKYAKVDIVSRLLDAVVELPIKAILRWIRQWNKFVSAKKDEL